jgi:hypothetical protein
LATLFTHLLDWVFAFTKRGAQRRLYSLLFAFFTLWVALALLAHPIVSLDALPSQIVGALFAPDVLRHLLIFAFAMFIALYLASFYLQDIFEINNPEVAIHFIRMSAFSGRYPGVVICDGRIDEAFANSPVSLIGGPGVVDVHLENVALFEKIDGTPDIIGPTFRQYAVLDGFERMRSIFDLRDQFITLTIKGRTQDGIPVEARDVRLAYSIYRGGRRIERTLQNPQPYPFVPQAVLDLTYKQGKEPNQNAMRGLIIGELSRFISQHTLDEFLSSVQIPYEEASPTIVTSEPEKDSRQIIPRDKITGLFYDYAKEFSQKAGQRGVQLEWIGLGTWVTPSNIIPERHFEAWKLSSEARIRRSRVVLEQMQEENRLAELLRLIDEIPALFYNLCQQNIQPDQILRELALAYREKLRYARDLFTSNGLPVPPEIDATIRHLTLMGAIRLGQGRA